jgi:hypothetical protein
MLKSRSHKRRRIDHPRGFIRAKRLLTETDILILSSDPPFTETGDVTERYCLPDMLVGHSCEFGSECNFHHITYDEYQNVLEPVERDNLQAWILSKSEDLEVLPSLGPAIVEAQEADGEEDTALA